MIDMVTAVKIFHEKFEISYDGPPRILDDELLNNRLKFLFEELTELTDAAVVDDQEGILDALVDLVYVALGTAHLMGLNFDEAFRRVHMANMKKEQAHEGTYKGGIIKPFGWVPPDLSDLVARLDFNG